MSIIVAILSVVAFFLSIAASAVLMFIVDGPERTAT
jgi:hypothetical protein